MKPLFIIMILLLPGSWSSFSQSVIPSDTLVSLAKWRAMRAAQDLIRYDDLKIRTDLLQEKIQAYEKMIIEKDGIISEQKGTIARTNQMFNNQSQISTELQLKLFNSKKEVKKQNILKWVGYGVAVVMGFFALK